MQEKKNSAGWISSIPFYEQLRMRTEVCVSIRPVFNHTSLRKVAKVLKYYNILYDGGNYRSEVRSIQDTKELKVAG